MKNKIEDLRNHLFATLEALQDKENPMPIDRALAISGVAQTIINSAKAEVDFLKATGATSGTGFIQVGVEAKPERGIVPRIGRAAESHHEER